MSSKRLRVFAGPNGSGKTTIINKLRDVIPYGVYVNADDIESSLKNSKILIFNAFQLQISEIEIQTFFKNNDYRQLFISTHNFEFFSILLDCDLFKNSNTVEFYKKKEIK